MTEYTDVPKVNELHAESQKVAQALDNLESGGTINSIVVSPPPFEAPAAGEPVPLMKMAVSVTIPPPVDATLQSDFIAWLNTRLQEIANELTALGVTVPPTGDAQWSTPPAPPGLNPIPQPKRT